jgi:hypothetical protein
MSKQLFKKESRLVAALLRALTGDAIPWHPKGLVREFDYVSGRTDVLALTDTNQLIAFEAKLQDWRRAIRQAWRSTSYVDMAYVVLPADRAYVAKEYCDQFLDYGVGLCLICEDGLRVAIESSRTSPVLGWLSARARDALVLNGRKTSTRTCRTRLRQALA